MRNRSSRALLSIGQSRSQRFIGEHSVLRSAFFILGLVCCLSSAGYAQPPDIGTAGEKRAERRPPETSTNQQTTLRVAKPVGVFANKGGANYIIRATVEVKNVGEAPANDVRVTLRLPTGVTAPMYGESEIQPKKSATYSYLSERDEPVPPKKELRTTATCANCRN